MDPAIEPHYAERLRSSSPTGQASLRKITRDLAKLRAQNTPTTTRSQNQPSTPTPFTGSTRPTRKSVQNPAAQSPATTKQFPASPDIQKPLTGAKAVIAAEREIAERFDSFTKMFGGYAPPSSKATSKTTSFQGKVEKVKKGKKPGERRVSVINYDWNAGKKESTPRVLFPRDLARNGHRSGSEVMNSETMGFATLGSSAVRKNKEEEDKGTPGPVSSVASKSVVGSPKFAFAASTAASRARYNLRSSVELASTTEKSKKRKRD